MRSHRWVIDFHFHNNSRAIMYRVQNAVAHTSSDYQDILIVDLVDFGRALFLAWISHPLPLDCQIQRHAADMAIRREQLRKTGLDGSPQSSAMDEYIYHEALVHPALIASRNAQKVFVAGGGEGAVLREALKHNTVEQVIMVDIDKAMIDLARQHLSLWHQGAFDDPRVQILCQDAREYLTHCQESFDCILMDVADPLSGSPAALLFTQEFFGIAKSRLNRGGTFATQAEPADICDYSAHTSIVKTLRGCFDFVYSYQVGIPFYGSTWGFVLASDSPLNQRLKPEGINRILAERDCSKLRFYDAESHLHMFSLPKYLRDAIKDPDVGAIISDNQLLVVE